MNEGLSIIRQELEGLHEDLRVIKQRTAVLPGIGWADTHLNAFQRIESILREMAVQLEARAQ